MKSYTLTIAGYHIRFESVSEGFELVPSQRFLRNISAAVPAGIVISVHQGAFAIPPGATRVFHAPYVEEIDGAMVQQRADFWSVWKHSSDLYIHTIFPLSGADNSGVLRFSMATREWDLWIDGCGNAADPFEYPLDGLVLYYLTVMHGDILIHASGINHAGRGYLFTGISGQGKSTMAKIWEDAGASVIHDDRLIIRKSTAVFKMYNTPVYKNDEPRESPLNTVYVIRHGAENSIAPLKGAVAVSRVLANCIQHNWGPDKIAGLLESLSGLFESIPAYSLAFRPDRSVIDHILENEGKD